jgi:hypothetical protein
VTAGRLVRSWLLVIATFVVGIVAIDRVPSVLTGTPHGLRVYASIEEAERAVGTRVWLPPSRPDSLAWPPRRIEVWPGPPPVVAVRIPARGSGVERLVVVQSLGAAASPPAALLPAAEPLAITTVPVGTRQARLTRGVSSAGELLHEISWDHGSRRFVLRYRGPVEELMRMADGLERRLP